MISSGFLSAFTERIGRGCALMGDGPGLRVDDRAADRGAARRADLVRKRRGSGHDGACVLAAISLKAEIVIFVTNTDSVKSLHLFLRINCVQHGIRVRSNAL